MSNEQLADEIEGKFDLNAYPTLKRVVDILRAPSPAALDPTWRDNLYADGKTPDKKSIDEVASQYRNQHLKEASMGDMPTITTTPAVLDPVTVEACILSLETMKYEAIEFRNYEQADRIETTIDQLRVIARALIGQPRDAEAVGERLKIAFELEEFAKRGASYEANKTMRKAAELLRASPSNPQGEPQAMSQITLTPEQDRWLRRHVQKALASSAVRPQVKQFALAIARQLEGQPVEEVVGNPYDLVSSTDGVKS